MRAGARSCKVILLGDSGVGKTTLIHNFITHEFRADFKATLGADLSSKTFTVNGQLVDAQLWDTAGTERFRSMGASFYRGTDVCIFVYDITSPMSLEHLDSWKKELAESADFDDPDHFPFVVVANKSDLGARRQVSLDEGEAWAKSRGCPHFAVSAKTGQNVEEAFRKGIQLFIEAGKHKMYDMKIPMKYEQRERSSCC